MKTPFRFATLMAIAVIALGACSSASTPTPAPAATPAASAPASASAEASSAAPESPSAAPLTGELTLWHSYGSGGGETGALDKVLTAVRAANPGLTINVVEQPFDQLFNKWNTDVAAGGGPDLFIAPNDNLFTQSDAGVLQNLDQYLSNDAQIANDLPVAIDGSKVGGSFFMVPESLKAVALWYDKSKVATPPTTTDAMLAAVKDGSLKLGLNQSAYHNFGFTGSFGGKLMDDTGKCVADQGGFADAFKFLADLKAAGAKFYTDGNALKQDFQTGKLNATVDGPWQTADFRKALGDNLAVTKMPAGPNGAKADPFTGTDGWYINPNGKNIELAVKFALLMVSVPNEQVFVDDAGHVPADPGAKITDPITQGFSDAAAEGLARPQSAQFNNWWGPFGDALNQVLDKNADPTKAIADACSTMNKASGL